MEKLVIDGWSAVVTLVPFFIFSLFHMFAYIPSVITPVLFPEEHSSPIAQACQSIKQYTDEHHEMAMQLAAYVEVVGVMGQLLLGVLRYVLWLSMSSHILNLGE